MFLPATPLGCRGTRRSCYCALKGLSPMENWPRIPPSKYLLDPSFLSLRTPEKRLRVSICCHLNSCGEESVDSRRGMAKNIVPRLANAGGCLGTPGPDSGSPSHPIPERDCDGSEAEESRLWPSQWGAGFVKRGPSQADSRAGHFHSRETVSRREGSGLLPNPGVPECLLPPPSPFLPSWVERGMTERTQGFRQLQPSPILAILTWLQLANAAI